MADVNVMEVKMCRSCYHSELKELLDLGEQYIINFGDKEPIKTPIVLLMCNKCKLVQLKHYVDPDLLYKYFYYKSGVNQTMRTELKNIVNSAMKLVDPCPDDTVIDIGCFPAGTMIECKDMPKPIENIKKSDLVLTGSGKWRKIKQTFKRKHQGHLYNIFLQGQAQFPLKATPNHPLLVAQINECGQQQGKYIRKSVNSICWKRANELRVSDWLVFPKPEQVHSLENLFISDFVEGQVEENVFYRLQKTPSYNNRYAVLVVKARNQKPVINEIEITPSFLKLCGLYIAEGSSPNSTVDFAFGYYGQEIELANECAKLIKEVFNFDVKPSRGDHSLRVRLNSATIASLFRAWFGNGAKNKHIPSWMSDVSNSMLNHLLNGMMLGDGHYTKRPSGYIEFYYSTASKILTYQLRLLLLRLGIACRINVYAQGDKQFKDSVIAAKSGDLYRITVGDTKGVKLLCGYLGMDEYNRPFSQDSYLFSNNYLLRPIKKIDIQPFDNDVYNLEVEEENNFVAEGVLVHNSNDGTLLLNYPPFLNAVGFEPAENLCTSENYPRAAIINGYFSDNYGLPKAKIITAISMFYDLQEPNVFMNAVKNSLHPEGILIIQMNYLVKMIENNAVDNILIEHVCFYTLNSLQWLLDRVDMTIFRAELNEVNGGSIRIYIKHRQCDKYPVGPEVDIIKKYVEDGYATPSMYEVFKDSIDWIGAELYSFIRAHGPVWALGASTRGNTMLQMFGINNELITAVADRNESKVGTTMVGTNIPVKSEDEWRKAAPEYTLILPYYFSSEIIKREKDYLAAGGKFIIPLPTFQLI